MPPLLAKAIGEHIKKEYDGNENKMELFNADAYKKVSDLIKECNR